MTYLVIGLVFMLSVPLMILVGMIYLHYWLRRKYIDLISRIFQEKPLFIIPRGEPASQAEEVTLTTPDGLHLKGCYFSTPAPRRGVIVFGLEFGSNRWSCIPYCEHLVDNGFDVFALEFRNQGDSDKEKDYDPLQWVTDREVTDARVALAYLKGRPDADPNGVGVFGISKGAGAYIMAAAHDPYIRCLVTDGLFASMSTLVQYMRQWFRIYDDQYFLQGLAPTWYYVLLGEVGIRNIEKERKCHFVPLERAMGKIAPRPLLMIHGGADTYIKPEMSRLLYARARPPKEFWLVEGAKHNQAMQVAGEAYHRRVLDFFVEHLEERKDEHSQGLPGKRLVLRF